MTRCERLIWRCGPELAGFQLILLILILTQDEEVERRAKMKRLLSTSVFAVLAWAFCLGSVASAQVSVAVPIEQSGAGAVVGMRWIRGVEMAV
jgi:hypothetical protein